mmetsp:Transcript_114681/g.180547  ORF Transcript_114681/g.180547 Transcript_114681/m.180547 type:complete len:140 (+) Transcript_114681:72-491(+)
MEADYQGDFKISMSSHSPSELSFCKICRMLFAYETCAGSQLVCATCGYVQTFDEKAHLQNTKLTMERVKPPWWLLEDERLDKALKGSEAEPEHAEIDHECEQCGAKKVQFWTRQLRSADEGQTIFYLCKKCGWRAMEHS